MYTIFSTYLPAVYIWMNVYLYSKELFVHYSAYFVSGFMSIKINCEIVALFGKALSYFSHSNQVSPSTFLT